jgi:hypothetical protein
MFCSRSTLFDHVYVDDSLLGGMERVRDEMDELIFFLNAEVSGAAQAAADGAVSRLPFRVVCFLLLHIGCILSIPTSRFYLLCC